MTPHAASAAGPRRFAILDGWRALSILLVLAGHLLPIGPARWGLNAAVAAMGMAIFFTLSGFLITRFLSEDADLRSFLIRRLVRIVPLAWIAVAVACLMDRAPAAIVAANLLFYANLPPQHLTYSASHLWSLGVEMQFYVGIGLWVALAGRRGLYAVPLLCLAVTALRVATGTGISIVTWLRLDEILAGGTLALVYGGWFGAAPQRWLGLNGQGRAARGWATWALLPTVLLAADERGGVLQYLRPYLCAWMVGASLFAAPPLLGRLAAHRWIAHVAAISYGLYIIHGVLRMSWLGTGDTFVKYAKRPLLFVATFLLAHLSHARFEQPLIAWARRRTRGRPVRTAP